VVYTTYYQTKDVSKPVNDAYHRIIIRKLLRHIFNILPVHAVGYLVEALSYNPEGRRFGFPVSSLDFFNRPNPSNRTMSLASTQSLTEMSTRNLPGGKGRPARKSDITAICDCLENVGVSTTHNPMGLHGLLPLPTELHKCCPVSKRFSRQLHHQMVTQITTSSTGSR
jgi:hypothetical protein